MRDEWVALEVHLRDQALREGLAEYREVDVRRAPTVGVVAPWVGAGFDGAEVVVAVGVGERAPAAAEVGVYGCQVGVFLVAVAAASVGLPDFQQGVGHGAAVFVEHAAVDDDALADGVAVLGVVLD